MKTCGLCGGPCEDGSRFCRHCGQEFPAEPEALTPAAPAEPVPPLPPSAPADSSALTSAPPVSTERMLVAAVSYVAAYFFVRGSYARYQWQALLILSLTVAAVELLNKNRPRPAESWVWLACYALNAVSFCFGIDDVWEDWQTLPFSVVFGVWWTLSRSGKLMENRSGHLLPADGWTGFAVLPFGNYLLRWRTITAAVRRMRSGRERERSGRGWWMAAAALVCLLLFIRAAALLTQADSAFGEMLGGLLDLFDLDFSGDFFLNLALSIPFGCLGCGLILGSASDDCSGIDSRRERLYGRLSAIRRVPEGFWAVIIGLFSVLYAAFFVLQGSYLFGAFAGQLPEGFIVAEYARQGFFELCRVMVVNSAVLWLATRMVTQEKKHEKGFLALCLCLLAESVLFSLIAFSKLALYISIYGFTPLRLQSTWLVCVLLAACLLWGFTLLTGRPVFRKWMIFGAATLSILAVV